MKKLTVSRSKWLRGKSSLLCDIDGNMCIVGHILHNAGVSLDDIRYAGDPCDLEPETIPFPLSEQLVTYDTIKYGFDVFRRRIITNLASDLMRYNDSTLISDTVREVELVELCKQLNIQLEFED